MKVDIHIKATTLVNVLQSCSFLLAYAQAVESPTCSINFEIRSLIGVGCLSSFWNIILSKKFVSPLLSPIRQACVPTGLSNIVVH